MEKQVPGPARRGTKLAQTKTQIPEPHGSYLHPARGPTGGPLSTAIGPQTELSTPLARSSPGASQARTFAGLSPHNTPEETVDQSPQV